jgi:uncharacterized protein YidB (DUF937 family)
MGFLGNLGNLAQNLGGGGQGALVTALLSVLQNRQGGIAGLAAAFQQHGLGDVVQSWIGTGQNQPISPDQVTQVLGHDQVQQVANEADVSHEEAKSGIAAMLPQIVDHLTPNGQLPQSGDLMSMGMQMLKGKLFG